MQRQWQWWALIVVGILLLLSSLLRVNAQKATLTITTTKAESTFAPVLAQPMKLLQAVGITAKEVQKQLTPRPHISVAGGSIVLNLGLKPLTGTQDARSAPSSIHVAGDGVVRDVSLAAPKAP